MVVVTKEKIAGEGKVIQDPETINRGPGSGTRTSQPNNAAWTSINRLMTATLTPSP